MARQFNGTTDYIDLSTAAALDPTAGLMSAGIWALPTQLVSQLYFMGKVNSTTSFNGWAFGHDATGKMIFYINGFITTSTITLTSGVWAYCAVFLTFAGSTTTVNFVRITPAGVVTTSQVTNAHQLAGSPGGVPLGSIGANKWNAGARTLFVGSLAEASIWINKTLAQKQLMAAAFGGGPMSSGVQPTLYTPIRGDSPEPDLSGNKLSGTVNGTPTVVKHPGVMPGLWLPKRGFQPMPV